MKGIKNRVQLIGKVGTVPEILTFESGKKMARFSIATNEAFQNTKGEKVIDTQWHHVVAWDKTAELVQSYVPKGRKVGIEGRLTTRSYDDKDGYKRYVTEVVCHELQLQVK